MLEKVLLGNSVENWGVAMLIVLGTVAIVKLIAFALSKTIKVLTSKTDTPYDDVVYKAIEAPILFTASLVGIWIAIHKLTYPSNYETTIVSIYKILTVFNFTWLFSRLIVRLFETYFVERAEKHEQDNQQIMYMLPSIKRVITGIVWLVGVITALSNVGVDISALLGTLGIGGIALALAAQDTVKNVFASITIFTDRSFKTGDVIKLDNYEGTIVDIGIRSTKMLTYDKRMVTFPNYRVADTFVTNISSEPRRRVVMSIGLAYDTSSEKMREAMKILEDISNKVEYVSSSDIVANFSNFADAALIVNFTYYIQKEGHIPTVTSNVNIDILAQFNDAKIEFAFPRKTIRLEME